MNEHISVAPQVCHGQACLKEREISSHRIIRMLAGGDQIEDLLGEYHP